MNIFRVFAVSRKEAKQIIRDSRSLYLALGIPIMLMIVFGYALSLDVDNIPLAVWDRDRTPQSREFIDRLTSSGYFNLIIYTDSYEKIIAPIDNNRVSVGIIIPHDFARNLKKGKQFSGVLRTRTFSTSSANYAKKSKSFRLVEGSVVRPIRSSSSAEVSVAPLPFFPRWTHE